MKTKSYIISTEEGVAAYTARLSSKDFRQGRSHSGNPKFSSWEKFKLKSASRSVRHKILIIDEHLSDLSDIVMPNMGNDISDEYHHGVSLWNGNKQAKQHLCYDKLKQIKDSISFSAIEERRYTAIAGYNLISGVVFDPSMSRSYRRRGDEIINL